MRADLRLLGNDRAIDMVDDRALRAQQIDRMVQESDRRRAFPLRVGRREMLADVAEAGGAEQGVGDRVEHDVGVAVAGKAARSGALRRRRA